MLKLNANFTNSTFVMIFGMFERDITSIAWSDNDWNTVEIDDPRFEDTSSLIFINKSNKKNAFALGDIKSYNKYEVADAGIIFSNNKDDLLMIYTDESTITHILSKLRQAGYIN